MDNRSLASPPLIRVCDSNATSTTIKINNTTHNRLLSRSPPYRENSDPSPSSYGRPMAIPKSNEPLAPPPLPPPRFIEDLAQGHDSGWKWGNAFEGKPTLAPIKPSSSLFGGHSRPPLVRRDETFSFTDEYRRAGTMSVATSPSSEVNSPTPLTAADAPRSGSLSSTISSSRLVFRLLYPQTQIIQSLARSCFCASFPAYSLLIVMKSFSQYDSRHYEKNCVVDPSRNGNLFEHFADYSSPNAFWTQNGI